MRKSNKLKIIVCSLLFLFNAGARAHNGYWMIPNNFSRIYMGGSAMRTKNYLAEPAHGFLLGYTKVYQFDFPLMVQAGLDVNYLASHSKQNVNNNSFQCHDRFLTTSMPINLGLHFGNDELQFVPYTGFNIRLNAVAKSYIGDNKTDYFDEKNAKRFVPGFNAGVDINFIMFYIGYCYTTDLIDFIPDHKSRNTYHCIKIGFNLF